MLVNELRTALEQYDKATLKEIAVMLYKKIPKRKKEDDGLDDILLNFTREKAKTGKTDVAIDFSVLADEVVQFMRYMHMHHCILHQIDISARKNDQNGALR